jgi:hypothetical protein
MPTPGSRRAIATLLGYALKTAVIACAALTQTRIRQCSDAI